MKVLLVYPNISGTLTPQIGILALGTYLLEKGVDASVCDLSFTDAKNYSDYLHKNIVKYKPDLVAFSCRTMEFSLTRELAMQTRKLNPGLMIVVGGPHATFEPNEIAAFADFGVMGDGEEALLDIVTYLDKGKKDKIKSIENVFYQKDDNVIVNPMRPLFQLNNSPMPRFELFDERHYTTHSFLGLVPGASVCGVFEGSRGCPYKCTYCSSPTLMEMSKGNGKWRREKPVPQIRAEIDKFKSIYGLEMIYFVDEVMMTSDQRTTDFRNGLQDLNIPFVFMYRPELIKENRVRDMKAAGAYSCSIGIESGNEGFREQLLKRRMKDKRIIESYQVMKEIGIKTHSFIMIGLPEQTPAIMEDTYDLLREIQPDSAQATTFYPLPATALYKQTIDSGLFTKQDYPFSYYGETYLNFNKRQKKMIRRYVDIINVGLWKKKPGRKFLAWLSRKIPYFSTLLWTSTVVWGSMKRRGLWGTMVRIKKKLKAMSYSRQN